MKDMETNAESYIEALPMPKTNFLDSEQMQQEYERVCKIKKEILTEKNDCDMEVDICDKPLETQLEYSSIKRLNLELMQEYGLEEWNQQQSLDMVHNLKYQEKNIDKEILDINKKRKFAQKRASNEICKSYYKTKELIEKNIVLEQEILKLKQKEG
eukprot:CAMPEP_0205813384 /NCGR_PEP_ID=MMETSP0205-20121125/18044_1 /ASSEMBLY_ACC=CAM_ASM_000278 /TAXON_ID=36767 /ORGANISM="Euplotes focardii, Strain TN1" /LENGTH=155 /DNA_ID=CAMNT_0053095421 /DNA_START=120 /DNA_END=584 /DNA_ORIENTATION=+